MPSEMKVNKISPASGTAITLGDSGDTFTIPSGATITNNGTQNGFGSTSASDLTSGTLPDARFPATLPAASGVNLTALNATNLGSGTLPDARFPATLPAASAANLTSIPAGNLTGTVADARISTLTASKLTGALPAISGASLTNLPSTGMTSHVRAYSGSGQNTSITTNTMTTVEWSAETFDPDGDFNTTTDRYIAPANGYYLATATILYSGLSDGVHQAVHFTINGSIKSSSTNSISISPYSSVSLTDIYYMTANQYLQVKTYHENSNTKGFDADGWGGVGPFGSGNFFSITRLA